VPGTNSTFSANRGESSYKDIVVGKLLAFFGRATHRDAEDLFFILDSEAPGELLPRAKKKDPEFDLYWLAVALKHVEQLPESIGERMWRW
jgi:hypothetical protein